jgi:hypothetical protein
VVGLNTSAFLEAAILRKPVFTVLDPRFYESQRGTFHLDTLLAFDGKSGIVRTASDLSQHVADIEQCLNGDAPFRDDEWDFILQFVRPDGENCSATAAACNVLESEALKRLKRPGKRVKRRQQLLRRLIFSTLGKFDLAKRRVASPKQKPARDFVERREGGASVDHIKADGPAR